MSSAPDNPRHRARRWWLAVLFAFFAQLSLIFMLGEKKEPEARTPAPAPGLRLVGDRCAELLALDNPTLFALPHPRGFAGMAWLKAESLSFTNTDWTEDPRWQLVPTNQLGVLFNRIPIAPFTAFWQPEISPQPDWLRLRSAQTLPLALTSTLRVEGALAAWPLARDFELPSWPARVTSANDFDLLTNTVVQALVDGAGETLSATLLTSSGSQAADDFALNQVRRARFQPPGAAEITSDVARSLSRLCWGRFVFEWHTLPATTPPLANP